MSMYILIIIAILSCIFFSIHQKEKKSDTNILKTVLISAIAFLSIAMCIQTFLQDESTLLKIAKASSGELEGQPKSDAYSHLMQKSIENLTSEDASGKLKILTKNFVENCLKCLNEEKNQEMLANVSDTLANSFKKSVLPWKT